MKNQYAIKQVLQDILTAWAITDVTPQVAISQSSEHGEYSSNVAMVVSKRLGKSPMEIAEEVREKGLAHRGLQDIVKKIEVVKPGFINFFVKKEGLMSDVTESLQKNVFLTEGWRGKKIFIEYAHPNTHKEMHIGHMRTLITGEALARLFAAVGATVFRANYQGDIGLHIAKALYGIEKLMQEKDLSMDDLRSWNNKDKAHFLGQGYARGSQDYEEQKEAIDDINKKLYSRDERWLELYQETRQWNLDYYDEFYQRFYTKFDRLFFESDVDAVGKEIVLKHVGDVFQEENGAIVFPGEKYGLHTRVFITQLGNPTYEGKEMGNAVAEYEAFTFDKKIHVVANEQNGYFQVVFKALDLIDPEKFEGKQEHVSMGMVQLADRKISSRTGDVLTVDWLLDQVEEKVVEVMKEQVLTEMERKEIIEQVVIGAVKYSVLKVATGQDVAFDIEKSVSLQGNSGPYVQYTYVRCMSILRKGRMANSEWQRDGRTYEFNSDEFALLRQLSFFTTIISQAAEHYSPHMIATYLFELAQLFNHFYQKVPILKAEKEQMDMRLFLVSSTANVIHEGLQILGIKTPEKM